MSGFFSVASFLGHDTRGLQGRSTGRRRRCCHFQVPPQKGHTDVQQMSYKHFWKRIMRRHSGDRPVASTPLATKRRYSRCRDFGQVCQRLVLDSPPRSPPKCRTTQNDTEEEIQETVMDAAGVLRNSTVMPAISPGTIPTTAMFESVHTPEQDWMWTDAARINGNRQKSDFEDKLSGDLLPFAVLNKDSMNPQSKALLKMAAPSLLNDYYTKILDCGCNGMVALALGSSVYLWDLEKQSLNGRLHPKAPQHRQQAVSSVCWSRDGRFLSVGTRRGEIQLWDVECQSKADCLQSHLSVVGALSWKQHLLSSGSILGHIHHHDLRAPAPLVGMAMQQGGVCSLEWSPAEDRLASGSTDGLLSIWDGDVAMALGIRRPITTLKQPSAVKAMGWCPWQRHLIATGGGWKDGEVRIWDELSAVCVDSAPTHSQICSLMWAEKKRLLVTGHGAPHHQMICWDWDTSLCHRNQLMGHSNRVLQLAQSPCGTKLISAGADHCVHVWAA